MTAEKAAPTHTSARTCRRRGGPVSPQMSVTTADAGRSVSMRRVWLAVGGTWRLRSSTAEPEKAVCCAWPVRQNWLLR